MGLPHSRQVSQGARGALRGCEDVPVPTTQGQGEDEVSIAWLAWCCCPPRRRNQNYSDILHSLVLGDKRLGGFDLTLRFTHLFWFGDLNYRLDMDVQVGPHGHRSGMVAHWWQCWCSCRDEKSWGSPRLLPHTGYPCSYNQEGV